MKRVFIAATRQNDGKTTVSLGLFKALSQKRSHNTIHEARWPTIQGY